MQKEKIIIVDENDEIIGYKERGAIELTDIYRVSALWIQNSKGNILLAQRSFNKRNDPGKWGPAVAGTNQKGETYESNIIKEAEEEIGLKNITFQRADKVRSLNKHDYFCQLFFLKIDKPIDEFRIQKEEVAQIKWFPKDELIEEIKNNPGLFLPSVLERIKLFNK